MRARNQTPNDDAATLRMDCENSANVVRRSMHGRGCPCGSLRLALWVQQSGPRGRISKAFHGTTTSPTSSFQKVAHIAQSVEHILGKDEVTGSIPVVSSGERGRGAESASAGRPLFRCPAPATVWVACQTPLSYVLRLTPLRLLPLLPVPPSAVPQCPLTYTGVAGWERPGVWPFGILRCSRLAGGSSSEDVLRWSALCERERRPRGAITMTEQSQGVQKYGARENHPRLHRVQEPQLFHDEEQASASGARGVEEVLPTL